MHCFIIIMSEFNTPELVIIAFEEGREGRGKRGGEGEGGVGVWVSGQRAEASRRSCLYRRVTGDIVKWWMVCRLTAIRISQPAVLK